MIQIEIREQSFEPFTVLAEVNAKLELNKIGACNSFIGSMRDFNEGDTVQAMELEYYPGMTEKALHAIAVQAGLTEGS